jgi:hypothetical protein
MRRPLSLLIVLLLGSAAAAVQGAEVHTLTKVGEPALRVAQKDGHWYLSQKGAIKALPLPETAIVEALAIDRESLVIAAVETEAKVDRIHLLRSADSGFEALPAPLTAGATILQPTPLVGPAGLESLIWIEGADTQSGAVKSAFWRDSSWTEPIVIAPAGQGTQIALRAQRLVDNSFLAVWAAFDGQDDEILWSRFAGGTWSPARALTANGVPDVTPDVVAVGNGALIAWSFYDGNDYRLNISRFDAASASWSTPTVFGGKGSVMPRLSATENGAIAVARQASPRQWSIFELDAQGLTRRSAAAPVERLEPPAVVALDAKTVRIEWLAPSFQALSRTLNWSP